MARVLLAESDRRIGGFLAGILTEFGHEVTICGDAAEADSRLAAEPIDVVLTDCMLGGDAAAAFGRDWRARGIPTLSLTGRTASAERGRRSPLPLVDKPFRFADLHSVLDAVAACTADGPRRLRRAA
jgi:DNA-binding response OmpR family regulator